METKVVKIGKFVRELISNDEVAKKVMDAKLKVGVYPMVSDEEILDKKDRKKYWKRSEGMKLYVCSEWFSSNTKALKELCKLLEVEVPEIDTTKSGKAFGKANKSPEVEALEVLLADTEDEDMRKVIEAKIAELSVDKKTLKEELSKLEKKVKAYELIGMEVPEELTNEMNELREKLGIEVSEVSEVSEVAEAV